MQRHSELSAMKARMFVLGEAARDMNCTTKELRNKMSVKTKLIAGSHLCKQPNTNPIVLDRAIWSKSR